METRPEPVVGIGAPRTFGPVYQSRCAALLAGGFLLLAGGSPRKSLPRTTRTPGTLSKAR